MRYLALASDYDGTLAENGTVSETTLDALERYRQSGRKLILVTGRELPDLEKTFPQLRVFDFVVAENGALLYQPVSRNKRALAPSPPEAFTNDLKQRGVPGLSIGEVIVATWRPYENEVLASIRDLGLELQVIFNKEAVMVLPSGINKMTGLNACLEEMRLSRHNVVGVGDAENDHAFLGCCERSVAVANAIPALKDHVDWVTTAPRGAGVEELIGRILTDDLHSLAVNKHGLLVGHTGDEGLFVDPHASNVLVCGQSGSGKSTLVAGFLEQLVKRSYQTCLIDPEGDYDSFAGCVTVGDQSHPPPAGQILQLLDDPKTNLVINLVSLKMQDRPPFFSSLLSRLQEKALQEARPHWLVVDEAHHLLPREWAPARPDAALAANSLMLVTVHPEHVSAAALRGIHVVIVVGKNPQKALAEIAAITETEPPIWPAGDLPQGSAFVWFVEQKRAFDNVGIVPGEAERKRHRRKYAEGELEEECIFWFRGPADRLNLRVQNLQMFLQIAAGIDDETWLYHLHRRDYSEWFRTSIKDEGLAAEIARVEEDECLSPKQSRDEIAKAVETRYTAPA